MSDAKKHFTIEDLFSQDNHEAGAWLTVLDENAEPSPLKIRLAGMDSKIFLEAQREARSAFRSAVESGAVDKWDAYGQDTETLVACTLEWSATGGDFSKERVRELYVKAPYVREQVDRFIGKRANFIKG